MTAKFCVRCDKGTLTPVKVGARHGNSGGGSTLYACAGCAPHYPRQSDTDALATVRTRQQGNA